MASETAPLLGSGRPTSAIGTAGVEGGAHQGPTHPAYSAADSASVEGQHLHHKNQLGTINGCYVPCLLNIMGIVLFLRLGWVVGEAGILASLAMLSIATLQAVLTVLSLSALVTNGMVSTGGSYYMISRCLGPEFGGAIGLLFYSAYAMGVAFYSIGFATTVQSTFFPHVESPMWVVRLIGSLGLLFILFISLMGAEFFAKFNVLFFIIQFGSIAVGMISFLIPHQFDSHFTSNGTKFPAEAKFPKALDDNIYPDFTHSVSCLGHCDIHKIFAIMFPMVTGIMEGANLSGDLKNPAFSIPVGTLSALLTAFTIYCLQIVFVGGAFTRYVLVDDQNIYQNACVGSPYIVVVGILISSLSSALGSLFGGSRVLQAMARDNLMGVLRPFSFGSKRGDEPRVAVLFTWIVAQGCVMIGDIDVVAPIETSFFCLSYAVVNLTCFILSAVNAPNFRPTFKFYSWPTALLGAILNVSIMFYLNWIYATVTLVCMILLYVYLTFYGPATDWGDITNELIFHQVRKYLLRLSTAQTHSKFWKPNLLILAGGCDAGLLAFCNALKKGGLMVVGQVLTGRREELHDVSLEVRDAWNSFIRQHRLKSFVHTTTSTNPNLAYRILMDTSGLGGLVINTVVIPFHEISGKTTTARPEELEHTGVESYEQLIAHLESANECTDIVPTFRRNLPLGSPANYCQLLNDVLAYQKNCIVARNFGDGVLGKKRRIYTHTSNLPNVDVWIFGSWAANDGKRTISLVEPCSMSVSSEPEDSVPLPGTETAGPICFTGLVALLVQLGQIFTVSRIGAGGLRKQRNNHRLRIFHLANIYAETATEANLDALAAEQQLQDFCKQGRVAVEKENIKIFTLHDLRHLVPAYDAYVLDHCGGRVNKLEVLPTNLQALILNTLMKRHSANTCQLFVPMPSPPATLTDASAETYLQLLNQLSFELPPVALVASGESMSYISTAI
eukprot:m.128609 g.128609  ORF g.128609 m.128609 type:complete len:955 (-) comp15674_c0_seq2:46-2910(-)